jgi:hypothetical protein
MKVGSPVLPDGQPDGAGAVPPVDRHGVGDADEDGVHGVLRIFSAASSTHT